MTAREGYQHPIKFANCKSPCIAKRSPSRSTDSGTRHRKPYMELGKPDAGKPPVRFDEGREAEGHWPRASQSVASRLLYMAAAAAPLKVHSRALLTWKNIKMNGRVAQTGHGRTFRGALIN